MQSLSDDLATMSYRTVGKQLAPLIVRTRGHRLEGIWHAGSPMGMLKISSYKFTSPKKYGSSIRDV